MPKLSGYHKALDYSYAPGIFPSHALLEMRPGVAKRLLVHSSAEESEGVFALRRRCDALGIRTEVADHALSRISRKENCYAAIVFEKFEDTPDVASPHIVLHNPSDMGNLGTILRTCLGFGLLDVVIIHPAADVFDPRVARASMGALFGLRLAQYTCFEAYQAAYPERTYYPFMLDGSMPLENAAQRKQTPYSLIFGNEATGLPDAFAQLGQPVRILHSEKIDSLNLATAVSIAAYAFTAGTFQEES